MSIDPESDHGDVLRALLRQSLPSRHVDPARAARVREVVHAAWLEHRPARPSAWSWTAAGMAVAAAISAAFVLTRTPDRPAGARAATAGSAQFVNGAVTVRVSGDAAAHLLRAGDALTVGAQVGTGPDSMGTIILSDGVEVRVDRETTFEMTGERRLNLERGALYVDTAARRGPAAPIEIAARRAIVHDIGTRYEVRVYEDTVRVRVRVRNGRVQVRRGVDVRDDGAGAQLTLSPVDVRTATVPPFDREWGWIVRAAPPRQVDGRSLAEFLAWVEREGGRKVRFDDAAIEESAAKTIVYGTIDGLTVEEALDVVLPSCGLTHRIDGGLIRIMAADDRRGVRS